MRVWTAHSICSSRIRRFKGSSLKGYPTVQGWPLIDSVLRSHITVCLPDDLRGCVSIKDLFWSLLLLQWKKRSLHSLSVGCNQYLLQNAHPLTNKLDWNENLMDGEWDCDKDWGQQLRKTTVLVQLSLRLPIGGVCCIVLVCTQQPMTLAKIKSTILLFHPNEWTSWWIRYAMCILINYHLLMNNTSRGIESSDDCLASGMPW